MKYQINPQVISQTIIGTKSISRKKIFNDLNLKFKYRSANINEQKVDGLNNDQYDALKIAKAKAYYLSSKYKNKLIVTFDTTINFKKKTIYKCDNIDCCLKLLDQLSNDIHYIYTGMVFMMNEKIISSQLQETKIVFNKIDKKNLKIYLKKNFRRVSKAVGCYNIEGEGKFLFNNIYDSYYNIIGVDIIRFLTNLRKL